MNIYLINNRTDPFLGNIFLIKKEVLKSWYFFDFRSDSEPDPLTDPKHCQEELNNCFIGVFAQNGTAEFYIPESETGERDGDIYRLAKNPFFFTLTTINGKIAILNLKKFARGLV